MNFPAYAHPARIGAANPATAALQAQVQGLAAKVAQAKRFNLPAGTIASLARQLVCAQASLATALGLPAGTIASLNAQCRGPVPAPVLSTSLPTPPPSYPSVRSPDVLSPNAGGAARESDLVRITTLPVTLEMGGSSLPPGWLYQFRRNLHGNAPVSAVDLQIQRRNGNRLHAAVIAWLYANGQYDRPAFQDNGDRPWADIDQSQIVHVWKNGVLFA